ncbi:MAG: hypothetical protein V4671_01595 [Armatimonadota bacterium]
MPTNGTASRRYPRYLSFSAGELEARLQELGSASVERSGVSQRVDPLLAIPTSGRAKLLKSHSCSVVFPDGRAGCCHYVRGGPAWHIFRYEYEDKATLPTQHTALRLQNDVASIEHAARTGATLAYGDAVLRERREYFQRASETGGRRRHPERFQMKALRAKALSGKYAVCQHIGSPTRQRLLPVGKMHDRLEDANREWQAEHGASPLLVVACCNRLDRCWEVPRFNPLHPRSAPKLHISGAKRPGDDDWEYLPGPDESPDDDDEEGDGA